MHPAIQAELFVSDANRNLLTHAAEFIRRFKSTDNVVLVSGSRSAADELVYLCCDSVVRGVHRFTLRQLAGEIARPSLAARGWITAERLPLEAIIRQLIHSEETRKGLNYFGEVSSTPHFATAVYQTLNEVRGEGITPDQLIGKGRAGSDLAILLRGYEKSLTEHGLADGAACAAEATRVIGIGEHPLCGLPVLLHCVPIFHQREREFMEALVRNASTVRAVTPTYQSSHMEHLLKITGKSVDGDVSNRYLFAGEPAPERPWDDSFELFAAAAESLECAEIARRILRLASTGVAFDRVAVLVRSPAAYVPVLEEAFSKAGIDAYFSHGVQKPHSAGRALLALLEFAREGHPTDVRRP